MNPRNLIVIMMCFISTHYSNSQQKVKPKLVIGIVVDQMKAEYLYRFQDNYTENGFKRLMREGFNVKNTHYNYLPTSTGPGHASIYTGTTPTNHGVVANNWYSKRKNRKVYCAEDESTFLIDSESTKKEKSIFSRSPKNLLTSTITDELKLFSNGRSKVIGVSLKDRGAIFPAGHLADAAYWYNSSNGHFVTSSYYLDKLPEWLLKFNKQKKSDSLLNLVWKPYLPIKKYKNSSDDNADFEKIFKGKTQSIFPYNLKTLRKDNGNYGLITEIPQGNTLLTQLVKATLIGEDLGKGNETDFLTISYSSTDYVGHHFGIRSKELEDTYIRMDNEIAMLLEFLDENVGKENYTLFLTADHGASDHPVFLGKNRIPGKFYVPEDIKKNLNTYLSKIFGEGNYISHIDNTQIYFSNTEINKTELLNKASKFLKKQEGIKDLFIPELYKINSNNSTVASYAKNTYNHKISGDIIYQMESGWMEKRNYGTTHGTNYTSDTHVPLLWFGANIPKGETIQPKTITQIAPTLSFLLNIPLANTSNKRPIEELFE